MAVFLLIWLHLAAIALGTGVKGENADRDERYYKLQDAILIRYGGKKDEKNIPLALQLFEELLDGPEDQITVQCWVEIGKIHLFWAKRKLFWKYRDYRKAYKNFQLASNHGSGEADFYISFMHILDIPSFKKRNHQMAINYLRNAVTRNYAPAVMAVAYRNLYGIGIKRNLSRAIELYKIALKDTSKQLEVLTYLSPLEELQLSAKSLEPFRTPSAKKTLEQKKMRDDALKYWREKAKEGDGLAMYEVCKLLEDEPDSSDELASLYEKASQQGVVAATRDMGLCYMNGIGVPRNGKKAVEYLQKAVDYGDREAATHLGYLYYTGMGRTKDSNEIKKDYDKALTYLSMAAAYEIPEAMYLVGEILSTKGKAASAAQEEELMKSAFRMYRMAGDYGFIQALLKEAEMLEHGIGTEKNLLQAALNYKQVVEAPFTVNTITDSFFAYIDSDYAGCYLYNILGSFTGIQVTQYNLGVLHLERRGLNVVDNSRQLVIISLKRCLMQGSVLAHYLMGRLAEEGGREGLATEMYKKGFEDGDLECLEPLAYLFSKTRENRYKALRLLQHKAYRMSLDQNEKGLFENIADQVNKLKTWCYIHILQKANELDP